MITKKYEESKKITPNQKAKEMWLDQLDNILIRINDELYSPEFNDDVKKMTQKEIDKVTEQATKQFHRIRKILE